MTSGSRTLVRVTGILLSICTQMRLSVMQVSLSDLAQLFSAAARRSNEYQRVQLSAWASVLVCAAETEASSGLVAWC